MRLRDAETSMAHLKSEAAFRGGGAKPPADCADQDGGKEGESERAKAEIERLLAVTKGVERLRWNQVSLPRGEINCFSRPRTQLYRTDGICNL